MLFWVPRRATRIVQNTTEQFSRMRNGGEARPFERLEETARMLSSRRTVGRLALASPWKRDVFVGALNALAQELRALSGKPLLESEYETLEHAHRILNEAAWGIGEGPDLRVFPRSPAGTHERPRIVPHVDFVDSNEPTRAVPVRLSRPGATRSSPLTVGSDRFDAP